MSYLGMYLFVMLESISDVFMAIGLVLLAICGFYLMINSMEENPLCKTSCITGTIGAIFIAISLLTPTPKQAAAIYLVPKVVNNEQVQEVASEAGTIALDGVKILRKEMNSWLEEMECTVPSPETSN